MECKGVCIQILSFLAQMCSITKHCTSPPKKPCSLRALAPRVFYWCPCVVMYICIRVVMLSVRTHSGCSISMVIDRKGACNQREEGLKFYCGVVTRRHSFGCLCQCDNEAVCQCFNVYSLHF